jgi:hypothetical protein
MRFSFMSRCSHEAPRPATPLAHLVRRLGPLRAARVALDVAARRLRGEPFAHLPPAVDPRERTSRAQAAPVFVVYRALAALGVDDAAAITGELLELGAIRFLRKSIGPIRRADLAAMSEPRRRAWVDERARRFPNAVPRFDAVGPDEVRFTITACRFVSLAREAGHPELAPLFCRGDKRYFGSVERGVELIRPHTLAEGGPDCPFTIRFKPAARPAHPGSSSP